MNPNPPSPAPGDSMPDHDALEVQVTALLLGELSAAEAASLRTRIESDPALRTLHDRLRIAIELTHEATRPAQAKEAARPEAPRLDPARRDQLLAKLRTPAAPPQPDIIPLPSAAPTPNPSPTAGSTARRSSNRREWLAMAAMLVVLLATAAGVQLFSPERRGLYQTAAVDGRANTEWSEYSRDSSVNGRTIERFQFTDQEIDAKKGIKEQPVAPFGGLTGGGAGGFGGGGGGRQFGNENQRLGGALRWSVAQVDSTSAMQPPPAKPTSKFQSQAVREPVEEFLAEPMNRSDNQVRLSKNLVAENSPSQPPTAGTHEQNGQILFEAGKLEEAAAEFKEATKINPDSRAAQHYLAATEERLHSRGAAKRELASRGSLVEVETHWAAKLPKANPDANTPTPRRDADDFGITARADGPAPLPVLRQSLADNGLVPERELREAELGQKAESTTYSYALKPTPESLDALELFTTEAKQRGTITAASAQKPDDVAKDKTLGGLVVQESAGKKLSLLSARTKGAADFDSDRPAPPPTPPAPVPQPEVQTATDPFSTFSLNVSDVSFQLAAASLDQGALPAPGSIRTEEFINAFDYHDPMPVGAAPVAFAWERARDAFAHNRDLLRFSIKTAATGREATKPLNLVLLVDNSGSMERADRVRIRHECLRILAAQLQPQDRVSVVTFARTARLAADGIPGNQAAALADQVGSLTPEGGTHLEGALDLAYQTARRHFSPAGINRVVLLTDGAANLGDVSPDSLRSRVEDNRRQGVALDCFGIGWEGLNDDLLENLSRNGDGRYGFINTPEAATANFASQLAGALQVAASDVKVQVEFNPLRVTTHRQVGYARHQLKKEQFRDNTVDAAELAAAEAGNALYVVQSNPAGSGPIATVRVRFKVPGTADYRETSWEVPYEGSARALDQSSPAIRLAAVASNFAEWLAQSPHAAEVTPDRLLQLLNGIPQSQPGDPRPARLESMIRQARSLGGR